MKVSTIQIFPCIGKGVGVKDFGHEAMCFLMEDKGNGFAPMIMDGKIITFSSHKKAVEWLTKD